MALKLHDEYGFNYDNLKVLLGGWYGWQTANAQDSTAYPIEVGPGSSGYQVPGTKYEIRNARYEVPSTQCPVSSKQ